MILEAVHKLYKEHMGKKFDLEHWYEMLKDQLKWRAICDPPKSRLDSPKGSISTPKKQEMKVPMGVKDPSPESREEKAKKKGQQLSH